MASEIRKAKWSEAQLVAVQQQVRLLKNEAEAKGTRPEFVRRFLNLLSDVANLQLIRLRELEHRASLKQDYLKEVIRGEQKPSRTAIKRMLDVLFSQVEVLRATHFFKLRLDPKSSARVTGSFIIEVSKAIELALLANSLALAAEQEIDRLADEKPNSAERQDQNLRVRELLLQFAEGFRKIEAALILLAQAGDPQKELVTTRKVLEEVGSKLKTWWKKNG